MEAALIARLRGNTEVTATAGEIGGRPAVDIHERKSNDHAAFPAVVVTKVSSGRTYDQDGADGLEIPRMRFECFALSGADSITMARVVRDTLETAETVGGIRFHRGKVRFERSFPPEDLAGGTRVFRTILDMEIPATA